MKKPKLLLMASAMFLFMACGEGKVDDTSAEAEEGVEELLNEAEEAIAADTSAAAETYAEGDTTHVHE